MNRKTPFDKILSGDYKNHKLDTSNMHLTIDDLVMMKRIMDRDEEAQAEERAKERKELIDDLVEVLAPFFVRFEGMENAIKDVKLTSIDHEERLAIVEGKIDNIEKILKVA